MPQVSADHLTDSLAYELTHNRYLGRSRAVRNSEMTRIVDRVLEYYSSWEQGHEDTKLSECRDFLAGICHVNSISSVEAAYALYSLRDSLLENLAGETGPGKNESRKNIAEFFDLLAVHLMRSY